MQTPPPSQYVSFPPYPSPGQATSPKRRVQSGRSPVAGGRGADVTASSPAKRASTGTSPSPKKLRRDELRAALVASRLLPSTRSPLAVLPANLEPTAGRPSAGSGQPSAASSSRRQAPRKPLTQLSLGRWLPAPSQAMRPQPSLHSAVPQGPSRPQASSWWPTRALPAGASGSLRLLLPTEPGSPPLSAEQIEMYREMCEEP